MALGDISLAESCQVFFFINPHDSVVGSSLKQVAPLLLQVADAQIDFLHTRHLLVRQEGTLAHEILIDFLQQFLVFALQRVVLLVVNLLDALKQWLVERDLVLQVGEHGLHLLLYLAEFVRLVCLCEGEEYAGDTRQQATAILERKDGVLERCRILTVDNGLNVVTRLLDSSLKSRQIVGSLNLAEVRRSEG